VFKCGCKAYNDGGKSERRRKKLEKVIASQDV